MSGCGARGVARVLAPLLRLYASAVRGGEAEEAGGAGGAGAGAGALAVVDMFRELVGVLDGLAPDADGGDVGASEAEVTPVAAAMAAAMAAAAVGGGADDAGARMRGGSLL